MAANELSLSNVITISVVQTPAGLSNFNTSNIALFSTETPDPVFADGYKIYKEPIEVGTDFGTSSVTYQMALTMFSQQPNFLLPGGYLVVIPFVGSETLAVAIARTKNLVQYCGVLETQVPIEADIAAAAAVVQALPMIAFFPAKVDAAIAPGGYLDDLATAGLSHSRGLYYKGTSLDIDCLKFAAAYAARAMSTVFTGSLTTQNVNLQQLVGISPDAGITQTLWAQAQAAGVDTYVSFQGYPAVSSAGANQFFDQVYNLVWLTAALQIAGFNFLAGTFTKIPQTESGMDAFKSAYRAVMEQAVANQYLAPGVWNSPTTFGDSADLIDNVAQFGYYIYSEPVALQSQADRVDRKAPLIQIAAKQAGAINTSSVVVYVNQ